jgi:hypothetical protein
MSHVAVASPDGIDPEHWYSTTEVCDLLNLKPDFSGRFWVSTEARSANLTCSAPCWTT